MSKFFTVLLLFLIILPHYPAFAGVDCSLQSCAEGIPPGRILLLEIPIIDNILNFIWIIVATFAIIMIIVAGIKFLAAHGNQAQILEARQALVWGIVGIIVAIVGFSIVRIIYFALGLWAPI